MDSERKIAYGMATAPPLTQQPPPSYNYNPQQPPQYGFQCTQPPQPYNFNSQQPPLPYNFNSQQPPPPPPPPYSYNPPPPYYNYPTSISTTTPAAPTPPAYSPHDTQGGVPTQVPGVSYGLYPNLTDLHHQEQKKYVPMTTTTTNTTTTTTPVPLRPAPPPPIPPPQQTSQGITRSSYAYLKEGEIPIGHALQWRGGEGLEVFFVQREGFVVSPKKKQWVMSVYKKICVSEGCTEGLIEVHGCWRLKLIPTDTQVLFTTKDSYYTFKDFSTTPSRVVVIHLPSDVSKRMSEDLLNLLTELTDLRKEDGGMIEKVTTGVATVYDDITYKLNSVVKGSVPNAHKNTKWIRKNTGSLVRMGGSLVAKGIHLVADHIPATSSDQEQQEEESAIHSDLLSQLKICKKCLEENSVTYVN